MTFEAILFNSYLELSNSYLSLFWHIWNQLIPHRENNTILLTRCSLLLYSVCCNMCINSFKSSRRVHHRSTLILLWQRTTFDRLVFTSSSYYYCCPLVHRQVHRQLSFHISLLKKKMHLLGIPTQEHIFGQLLAREPKMEMFILLTGK